MKKLLYTGLALLIFGLVAVPSWAQKGGQGKAEVKSDTKAKSAVAKSKTTTSKTDNKSASLKSESSERSNSGKTSRKLHGRARAEEVQGLNTKADSKRGFSAGKGLTKSKKGAGDKKSSPDKTKKSDKKSAGKNKSH